MGLIGGMLGAGPAEVGAAVGGLAEVFVGNRAERDAAAAALGQAALAQYAVEFQRAPSGRFDRLMDGLNRLPRPLLVCGTLGLFAYSMISPQGFAERMESLALVPDPLWWLLGAIVSFYFGARELHYARGRVPAAIRAAAPPAAAATPSEEQAEAPTRAEPARRFLGGLFAPTRSAPPAIPVKAADPDFNAALEEWRALRR